MTKLFVGNQDKFFMDFISTAELKTKFEKL